LNKFQAEILLQAQIRQRRAALFKLSHYWRFYHNWGIIAGSGGKVNIYHIFLVNYQQKGNEDTISVFLQIYILENPEAA
jgi:hypothetical protein